MIERDADPLQELFRTELQTQSQDLSHALHELERVPDNPQALERAYQAAHTIAGAARIIHLDAVARLAASLEAELAIVRNGQPLAPSNLEKFQRAGSALAALCDLAPADWNTQSEALLELATSFAVPKAASPPPSLVPDAPPIQLGVAPVDERATIDPSLLEIFREEVRSHSSTLNAGLLELEREPSNSQRIEPLMRAAHSLKGAARIVGIDPAVHLAHAMEDAFVAAGAGRFRIAAADIDVLLRGADHLAALASEGIAQWTSTRSADLGSLRDAIAAMVCGETLAPHPLPLSPGGRGVRGEGVPATPPAVESTLPPPSSAVSPGVPAESGEAVVRVSAQSLDRLMGLAGESLVQSRWLQPFAGSLLLLKKRHDQISEQLDALAQRLSQGEPPALLVDALAEVRRQAARNRQEIADRIHAFDDHASAAEDLNSRLYREVIVSRMRPFVHGVQALPRLVRDTARHLGKQARLEIVGQATEVDRDILDKLEAPLTHLLRNAVDHGLESPEQRSAAGKPVEGLIRIEAWHRAGMLSISVHDDGPGIDVERIRLKVAERKLAAAELAARLGQAELLEFLFLPGFSTAPALTEVSGRGVGLDVVRTTVQRVGGSVHVTTIPGQGTTFHLLLPITLSVVRAVLVDIAGEPYAFPHNRIDRLLCIARREIQSLENRQFITVDDRHIGLVLAAQLLDCPHPIPLSPRGRGEGVRGKPLDTEELSIMLLSDATGTFGLIVESIRGEQDLVVRPLDPRLGKVPNISAAALLDDGSPVLIADIEDLIRSMDQFIQAGNIQRCDQAATGPAIKKRILVVDDSITVREVQRQILRTNGYEVEVAVDGQDGWNKLRAARFDLVISDVDMPRLSGLEFVQRIRDDYTLKGTPVIIVSYKDRDDDRLRGLQAGANHYLTKSSFHDATFLDAVAGLIGRA